MTQKTILITGGGSGLGQALAWKFAAENFQVYIVGRRQSALENTVSQFPKHIHPIVADIATESGRNTIIKKLESLKQLDFLVHNAATVEPICSLKEIPLSDLNHSLATNFIGPLFLTQQLLPKLNNARILHVSSLWAHQPAKHFGAYCTSKAALYMSKEIWNAELKDAGILVGSVEPGILDTEMQQLMRDPAIASYPEQKYFIHCESQHRLIKPYIAANFLHYILLFSSDREFIEAEWDIYDEKHQNKWLGKEDLPLPL